MAKNEAFWGTKVGQKEEKLTRYTFGISEAAILRILEAGIRTIARWALLKLAGPVAFKLVAFGFAAFALAFRGVAFRLDAFEFAGANNRVPGRTLAGAAFATGAALVATAAVTRIGFVRTATLYHPSFLPDGITAVI